ncbi:hypothetical protein [Blastomonas sp. UPD001]|uniref:hypothetical protein n=1 Tax=Blastomonas sp. UPD001 TaxID=2217673 RepID=UPI001E3F0D49|nr:hypothetical protein [Blastomonas sp. UPD001]
MPELRRVHSALSRSAEYSARPRREPRLAGAGARLKIGLDRGDGVIGGQRTEIALDREAVERDCACRGHAAQHIGLAQPAPMPVLPLDRRRVAGQPARHQPQHQRRSARRVARRVDQHARIDIAVADIGKADLLHRRRDPVERHRSADQPVGDRLLPHPLAIEPLALAIADDKAAEIEPGAVRRRNGGDVRLGVHLDRAIGDDAARRRIGRGRASGCCALQQQREDQAQRQAPEGAPSSASSASGPT